MGRSNELMDAAKLAVLRKLIAKRKRFDVFFSILGASLITLSLGVLAALALKLFLDGGSRLLETHLVTPWGQPPGMRDVIGKFESTSDGYQVRPVVTKVFLPTSIDSSKLLGQHVAINGEIVSGDVTAEAINVVPVTAPGTEIPNKPVIVGTIRSLAKHPTDSQMMLAQLEPDAMRVNWPDDNEFKVDDLKEKTVAVTPKGSRGRKAAILTIDAKSVTPLKSQSFFNAYPSKNADEAGIYPALIGTLMIMFLTALVTLPLGVAAGVYLEEYAAKNWVTNLIEINIANLAGVPSVIWGLLGLGLFVTLFRAGESVLAAGLTLGLLVLPIVIIATREAIRAIPSTIREASIGLGATKWQTVRYHVLPYSTGGILTGAIIAMSRAVGETAPLVLIGAATFINFSPIESANPKDWLMSQFSVLPMMTYEWVSRPEREFHRNAAAGSIVLLAVTLSMNAVAIYMRYRLRKSIKW